mmetsp:Transcript_3159/g.10434  ORF Transcript_3159/g.10434 Transcript_3159/m.10434 type:complete len:436 (+) Transcript_3159:135-1442(+)
MSLLMDSKRDDALLRTALLLLLAIVVLFLAVRFHAVSRSGGQQQQSFARMEEESDAAAAGARAHDRDRVGGPDIKATAADGAVPFGAVACARPPRVGTERSEAADELRDLAREKSPMHARRQRFGRIPSKRSVSKELSSYCAMCRASQEGLASAAAHGAAPPAAAEEAADASEPRSDLASGSSSVQGSVPLPSPVSMPPSLSDTFKDPRRGASGHGASAAEGQAPGGAAAPQGGRVGIAGIDRPLTLPPMPSGGGSSRASRRSSRSTGSQSRTTTPRSTDTSPREVACIVVPTGLALIAPEGPLTPPGPGAPPPTPAEQNTSLAYAVSMREEESEDGEGRLVAVVEPTFAMYAAAPSPEGTVRINGAEVTESPQGTVRVKGPPPAMQRGALQMAALRAAFAMGQDLPEDAAPPSEDPSEESSGSSSLHSGGLRGS